MLFALDLWSDVSPDFHHPPSFHLLDVVISSSVAWCSECRKYFFIFNTVQYFNFSKFGTSCGSVQPLTEVCRQETSFC